MSWLSCSSVVMFSSNERLIGNRDVVGFDDSRELHVHASDDGLRRDVILGVVGELLGAAAIGFVDGLLHRAGHPVGVENCAALDVARAAADGLDEGRGAAKITFLVGV